MSRDTRLFALVAIALVVLAFARGFGTYSFYDHWMYLTAGAPALAHNAPGEPGCVTRR